MEEEHIKAIVFNIIIPIFLGAVIYYVIAPEVIFVKYIDDFMGIGFHIKNLDTANVVIRLIRYYLLDMLWAYSLVFSVFFVLGNNKADLLKSFIVAFTFSTIMEVLQFTPASRGTFDMFDIVFEFLSEVVAVFIIKKHTIKEEI